MIELKAKLRDYDLTWPTLFYSRMNSHTKNHFLPTDFYV